MLPYLDLISCQRQSQPRDCPPTLRAPESLAVLKKQVIKERDLDLDFQPLFLKSLEQLDCANSVTLNEVSFPKMCCCLVDMQTHSFFPCAAHIHWVPQILFIEWEQTYLNGSVLLHFDTTIYPPECEMVQ